MSSANYKKVALIGSGTFGKAWLVKRIDNNRKYVIKEIQLSTLSQKDKEQSLTEVAVLAKCRHLNIIRYKEAFIDKDKGLLCIAMEYADGGDLHNKLKGQKGVYLAEDVIMDWFVQLSFALKYVHGQNILHRDLKCQNIFLTNDGILKLGDFGIAKVLQFSGDHAQTAIGTPYYMSPEICQHQPYNYKSDMWAAGCVLYEMACLKHPFDADSFHSLVMLILQGNYKPIPKEYGSFLRNLVSSLLDCDSNKRPSAEKVLCSTEMQPYVDAYITRQQKRLASANVNSNKVTGKSNVQDSDDPDAIVCNRLTGLKRPRVQSVNTQKRAAKITRKAVSASSPPTQRIKRVDLRNSPKYSLYMDILRRQKVQAAIRQTQKSAKNMVNSAPSKDNKKEPASDSESEAEYSTPSAKLAPSQRRRGESSGDSDDAKDDVFVEEKKMQPISPLVMDSKNPTPTRPGSNSSKPISPAVRFQLLNIQRRRSIDRYRPKVDKPKRNSNSDSSLDLLDISKIGDVNQNRHQSRLESSISITPLINRSTNNSASLSSTSKRDDYFKRPEFEPNRSNDSIDSNSTYKIEKIPLDKEMLKIPKILYESSIRSKDDPVASRIESLRHVLENQLGAKRFISAYNQLKQSIQEEIPYESLEEDMVHIGFWFPVLHQLIQLEHLADY